jgi:hypothetical protein
MCKQKVVILTAFRRNALLLVIRRKLQIQFSAYLKKYTEISSETLVHFIKTIRHHILEHRDPVIMLIFQAFFCNFFLTIVLQSFIQITVHFKAERYLTSLNLTSYRKH